MIRIKGLSFRYRGGAAYALRDVHLEISPGEFVVITGPSGCGKSTLALAIGGYLFRQFDGEVSGTVNIGDIDVRDCPIYEVADIVGLVQQNPEAQFCTFTVRDEIAFGLENRCLPREEIQERMDWSLDIVGAKHLIDRPLATLSGGEKQKIAIAAMMAAKPQVLIFDEPTSNLDPTATAQIFQVIETIRASAGITVIVIEHKVSYLRPYQPRLISLEAGRIIYDGAMPVEQIAPQVPGLDFAPQNDSTLVSVDNLCVGYQGHPVLHDLTLQIKSGEFVAVMGDNGAGKTTFLYCLMGLRKPDQGRVAVLGSDTHSAPVSQLARYVGFVFQNPDHQFFTDSVWSEAAFAARNFGVLNEAREAEIRGLLSRCGLADRLDAHPYQLSYGQKRRLNLVSVIAYRPKLILLDELLIGQDLVNAVFLLDLLRNYVVGGGAVIMVNHAPEMTRRYASRVLFFDNGRIEIDAPVLQAYHLLQKCGKKMYVA